MSICTYVCTYILKEPRCICYLCSLIQSQERTWILSSSSVQLCNYWQREGEEDGRGRRVPHKARTIYLPLLPQRQQLELICDRFSCLTGISREPQCPCREEQMIRTFLQLIQFGFNNKQKLNLKTKPLQLMYNSRF